MSKLLGSVAYKAARKQTQEKLKRMRDVILYKSKVKVTAIKKPPKKYRLRIVVSNFKCNFNSEYKVTKLKRIKTENESDIIFVIEFIIQKKVKKEKTELK